MNKYFKILEFDKIIDELKTFIRLEVNRQQLDNISLMEDKEEIVYALEEVDEASKLIQRMHTFPLFFDYDINYILDKTSKYGVINVEELLEIGKFFDTTKNLFLYEESLANAFIDHPYFNKAIEDVVYLKDLNIRVKEIVNQFGEILDTASPLLLEIRRKIRDTEKNIKAKLNEIVAKNSSKLTQSVVSIRNDRYVIPVKNDYKNIIKGFIHDQSSSGETFFIEPQVVHELNNKLNQLKDDEKKEIYEILKAFSNELLINNYTLKTNLDIIIHLDMVFGKANYGIHIGGNKVSINDKGIVDLLDCHHPLLRVENIVSNNISIGKDYQGIIITGPNTGGKTVLLKTIGLLSIMVKFALLIPCSEESTLPIFDMIYADIGDEQSINQNLSTFSSHLKNVIEIINNVTKNSLVLLDELGSGTDPIEGSALAIAIFDSLINKNCLVIATSHYSELKVHAFNSERIINASVEFDINTLKPTYKLLLGVPGQSNALHISKMLGLPNDIIKQAQEYTHQNSNDLDNALKKLIKQTKEMDHKIRLINMKKAQLNAKIIEADEKKEETILEKNRILKEAEAEAKKIVEKSQEKLENILSELNNMKLREVKPHEISNIKHEIKILKDETKVEESFIQKDELVNIGDSVYVQTYGCYGTIIKELKNNQFAIQIGNATITESKENLKRAKKDNVKDVIPRKTSVSYNPPKSVKMTLDLRGERYEDAKDLLNRYLDDAIYAGYKQVSIIHGFGTGVIRELVQTTLKKHKDVESFRYGGEGEGGQGATIVYFKN